MKSIRKRFKKRSKELFTSLTIALLLGISLLPTPAGGTHVLPELSVIPSEIAITGTVTITLICPKVLPNPATGNIVPLSEDTDASVEVETPLIVELLTSAGAGYFANADYSRRWTVKEGVILDDGIVKFEVQYPNGGCGPTTSQWHPSNPDFPVGEECPDTNLKGQYHVIGRCFYGLGTPDAHVVSPPNAFFVIPAPGDRPITVNGRTILFPSGVTLNDIIRGEQFAEEMIEAYRAFLEAHEMGQASVSGPGPIQPITTASQMQDWVTKYLEAQGIKTTIAATTSFGQVTKISPPPTTPLQRWEDQLTDVHEASHVEANNAAAAAAGASLEELNLLTLREALAQLPPRLTRIGETFMIEPRLTEEEKRKLEAYQATRDPVTVAKEEIAEYEKENKFRRAASEFFAKLWQPFRALWAMRWEESADIAGSPSTKGRARFWSLPRFLALVRTQPGSGHLSAMFGAARRRAATEAELVTAQILDLGHKVARESLGLVITPIDPVPTFEGRGSLSFIDVGGSWVGGVIRIPMILVDNHPVKLNPRLPNQFEDRVVVHQERPLLGRHRVDVIDPISSKVIYAGDILINGLDDVVFFIRRDNIVMVKKGTKFIFTNPPLPVRIDIKPGSDPNAINPRSRGRIPVAVLQTDEFNPVVVDVATVRFGVTGSEAEPLDRGKFEDVDGDGDLDLLLHFSTQLARFQEQSQEGVLTARTIDGIDIISNDSVRIVR